MSPDVLRAELSGSIVTLDDAEWDAARSFHSGVGEPDVVVRVATVDDVRAAVRYATAEGLSILVRGGGHSAWGELPGGVVIDLGALADIEVDGTTVRVGGGATWGSVAATLAPRGLGISSGDTSSVGVGGLTLGGGIGWMVRAWGLAADQLVGAQVIVASGEVVEVTAASHPDLFWALRGGGGNFGVVTRFDFAAHELPGVVFAELQVAGDARPILATLRDVLRDAPRALTVTYMDVPPMDPSAPPGATVAACWIGDDVAAAREALAPLLALEGVTESSCAVRDYPDILMDVPEYDPDHPMPGFIGGNTLLRDADDAMIDRLVAFREAQPASVVFLRSLGGAYGDVAQADTPFPVRDATWFAMAGAFDGPHLDAAERARVAAAWAEIEAGGGGFYGNFSPSTDPELVTKMYTPGAMARLAAVKAEWDPGNAFDRNHNVVPAAAP